MAAPSEIEGLRAAWRALGGRQDVDGWQTIAVSVRTHCTLLAGRRMPGGEEAVLLGFHDITTVPESYLPQGHGFEVLKLPTDPTGGGHLLLALARRTGGSLELFGMMAEDLLELLDSCVTEDEQGLLRHFLARIRAWQDFMDRHKEGVLAAEAEQGLFGELVMLDRLIGADLPTEGALTSWQGPLDGLQDFVLGTGAIEVKTTLSPGRFPAKISSLEQLDENLRRPLFIAAVRLALDPSGTTLPGMTEIIREKLSRSRTALEAFDVRLMQAGLLPTLIGQYTRRFLHVSNIIFEVQGDFPRLTRSNVHPAIRKAQYEIDLDVSGSAHIDLRHALELLGVA